MCGPFAFLGPPPTVSSRPSGRVLEAVHPLSVRHDSIADAQGRHLRADRSGMDKCERCEGTFEVSDARIEYEAALDGEGTTRMASGALRELRRRAGRALRE